MILIIIFIGIIIFILTQNSTNNNLNNTYNSVLLNESVEESNGVIQTYTIKSSKDKPIEKDGLEATNIQLKYFDDQIEIITTLQNNTEEDIQGFFICIR